MSATVAIPMISSARSAASLLSSCVATWPVTRAVMPVPVVSRAS